MNYWRLAIATTLAAFALISIAVSIATALVGPPIARRLEKWAPQRRATALFRLRITPAAAASLGAFCVVLPTFLRYEPRDTGETLAMTLTGLAGAGALLLGAAVYRAICGWRQTHALARDWRREGRLVDSGNPRLPVVALDLPYPLVAVVGWRRPVLFIAEIALRACSSGEIRAMIAHEAAHVAARDNLKRLVLRASPDVYQTGRAVERGWAEAAEEAADAVAARSHPHAALDLAQALIRIARLAPARPPCAPASAFYVGGDIDARVRRLLEPETGAARGSFLGRTLWLAGGLVAATMLIAGAPSLHAAIEVGLRLFP